MTLLKPSEVADRLSLSRSTVYAMIERGEIPASKLGAAVRIHPQELEDWRVANRIPPRHKAPGTRVAGVVDLEERRG